MTKELDDEISQMYDKCEVCHGSAKNKTYDPKQGRWIIIDCMICKGTGRESYANK